MLAAGLIATIYGLALLLVLTSARRALGSGALSVGAYRLLVATYAAFAGVVLRLIWAGFHEP
jgi:hypothetical protein